MYLFNKKLLNKIFTIFNIKMLDFSSQMYMIEYINDEKYDFR